MSRHTAAPVVGQSDNLGAITPKCGATAFAEQTRRYRPPYYYGIPDRYSEPITSVVPSRRWAAATPSGPGTCAEPGCGRALYARGMCEPHFRWWQWDHPSRSTDCEVPGCGKPVHVRGWCSSHFRYWQLTGDPLLVPPRKKRKPNERPPRVREMVSYGTFRHRLVEARGSASGHTCQWPDCPVPAWYWTLDTRRAGLVLRYGRDSTRKKPDPVAYSLNPDDYLPLCRLHHARFLRPPAPPRPVRPPADIHTVCAVDGCGRKVKNPSNELCEPHYRRRLKGRPLGPVGKRNARRADCSFPGCGRVTVAKGLCQRHYWQQRAGKPLTPVSRN